MFVANKILALCLFCHVTFQCVKNLQRHLYFVRVVHEALPTVTLLIT